MNHSPVKSLYVYSLPSEASLGRPAKPLFPVTCSILAGCIFGNHDGWKPAGGNLRTTLLGPTARHIPAQGNALIFIHK